MRISTESDLDSLARGAKLIAVVAAWSELGLWRRLADADGPMDLNELPANLRSLRITAAVLANAGLLDGGKDLWTLSAAGRRLFDRNELLAGDSLDWLGDLSRMSQVLREGGPVRDVDGGSKATSGGVRADDMEHTRRFLDKLYRRSEDSAKKSAFWVARRSFDGARALDLGGGHGRYAHELASLGMRVTLFDQPIAIELAKERFSEEISYIGGDYHTDSLGGPYDIVFMSNIVHSEPGPSNAALIDRVSRVLEPGGWLVIKDMFLDELGRDPEEAAFFGTTMLYYTEAGRCYSVEDAADWCGRAGLERDDTVAVGHSTLLFARKPD